MVNWKDKENAIRKLEHNGRVTPEALVAAARSEDHPCHGDFTWDDSKAADERRRDQARGLIRRVKFEVQETKEATPRRVSFYVPDAKAANAGNGESYFALPKSRSVSQVSDSFALEINMLRGLANRVYGIALSKAGMIGADTVADLKAVCQILAKISERGQDGENEKPGTVAPVRPFSDPGRAVAAKRRELQPV